MAKTETTAPEIWYIAVRPFDESRGRGWRAYREWRDDLPLLREVVTLDTMLCPALLDPDRYSDGDWAHCVNEDFLLDFFRDGEWVRKRISRFRRCRLLAVQREPAAPADGIPLPGFRFLGYDILDECAGNSLVTNCGPMPLAFGKADISEVGLVRGFTRAREIRDALRRRYADCWHAANCEVWAVWEKSPR